MESQEEVPVAVAVSFSYLFEVVWQQFKLADTFSHTSPFTCLRLQDPKQRYYPCGHAMKE